MKIRSIGSPRFSKECEFALKFFLHSNFISTIKNRELNYKSSSVLSFQWRYSNYYTFNMFLTCLSLWYYFTDLEFKLSVGSTWTLWNISSSRMVFCGYPEGLSIAFIPKHLKYYLYGITIILQNLKN
jgi:hypothetical protein